MGTIVQKYGPIYGEVVNGTVQGRPNGSVYVPLSNIISLTLDEELRYLKYSDATHLRICNSSGVQVPSGGGGKIVAVSQDLASNIQCQVYSDAELTTLAAYSNYTAGLFNTQYRTVANPVEGLTDEQPLYIRCQLMNNGVPVATSEVIEVTMVVPA